MKILKKIFTVGILISIAYLLWKGLFSSTGFNGATLEPFEFKIQDFSSVEVLDMEGHSDDLYLLGENKIIYRIDLDHKKVVSYISLTNLTNPIRFARLATGYTLIVDRITDNKSNIVLFNPHKGTTNVLISLEMKVHDILYSVAYKTRIALLVDENKLHAFSIKEDGSTGKISFSEFDDAGRKLKQKYEKITNLSDSIINDSSRAEEFSDVYGLVSQKEKMIYLVDNATYKIKTDKVANSVHPIGDSLYTLKYMIVAYKDEKGITFNAVKTPTNQKKRNILDKLLDNTVCASENHLSELKPIINMLASNIQNKFLEKNKNNHYYHEHRTFRASQNYDYVNSKEAFEVIRKTMNCNIIQPNHTNSKYLSAECVTPKGLKYTIGDHGDDGKIEVRISKDKTFCGVDFKHRRYMDFKAKSEGENAGYIGHCKLWSCIDFKISH